MSKEPLVYIILLNWNGWRDTIECLESLYKLRYVNFRIIVCDNDSQDDSVNQIKCWAHNNFSIQGFDEYKRDVAEMGGELSNSAPLVLIHTGGNLGYAGGNNVALRYILARNDFEYVWLLNNDTTVDSNALDALLSRMADPSIGICGSTLLFYDRSHIIQALGGGVYNPWFAISRHVGAFLPIDSLPTEVLVEEKLSYIMGASMFVRKEFLLEVGLLCEDYFLFFEELDWATRGRSSYRLGYAQDSRVYHKEGQSIGSSSYNSCKSRLADYYSVRSRLLFTAKFYPLLLPMVFLSLFGVLINRCRRGQFDRAKDVIQIAITVFIRLIRRRRGDSW